MTTFTFREPAMSRVDTWRMAREAGALVSPGISAADVTFSPATIERFADLLAAAERQAIAAEFDRRHEAVKHRNNYWLHAANYVRARGQS